MVVDRIEVLGVRELALALRELGPKFERNVPRAASRAAANVLRDAIRARTPVGEGRRGGKHPHRPGNLRRSIGLRETGRTARWKGFQVGPLGGQRRRSDGFYGGFVERGHKPHTPPHPFVAPAFDAAKHAALETFLRVARNKTEEAVRSVARPLPRG